MEYHLIQNKNLVGITLLCVYVSFMREMTFQPTHITCIWTCDSDLNVCIIIKEHF